MTINYDDLQNWSVRAAEALQEICDETQLAAGDPSGENERQDLRGLLLEHSRITLGQPVWQSQIVAENNNLTIDV